MYFTKQGQTQTQTKGSNDHFHLIIFHSKKYRKHFRSIHLQTDEYYNLNENIKIGSQSHVKPTYNICKIYKGFSKYIRQQTFKSQALTDAAQAAGEPSAKEPPVRVILRLVAIDWKGAKVAGDDSDEKKTEQGK